MKVVENLSQKAYYQLCDNTAMSLVNQREIGRLMSIPVPYRKICLVRYAKKVTSWKIYFNLEQKN